MQRYVLRWGWGQSTASSRLPQMDCLHFLTSSDRGRDAHLVHDAPSEAADQGVVLLQIVLHALYHVAHTQVVAGQACTRTSPPIKLSLVCPGGSGISIVHIPCTDGRAWSGYLSYNRTHQQCLGLGAAASAARQ